ncbi:MAG TPA: phenylalanine--tRNA ligase subunit beta [Caulobacteraceae bacterium]|jgi:phenylalanyl-tRNA synthetase beta chain|nr:phenylalanine--tRNA ligase subunit beta [Caulobacteraceae bacterium]
MKFTLSWLKDHLDTEATVAQVGDAMTMAGLEVEHIEDASAKLAPFTVAKVVEAVQHPNADRLRVCQVDTVDGMKEIVCGAPNARAGMTTIYAPIGAYVPGLGVTLVEKPVRGVVSNGMLCSGAELEQDSDADGILDLPGELTVGTPAARLFGSEAVIDFEVTPNRPDWLGVAGIARDLAATGLGTLKTAEVVPVAGTYPCPIDIRISAPEACRAFAGRVIRGVKNGPSPAWLQERLKSIGLRPINALVDVTNYLSYDRDRPLHVYDVAKLTGGYVEAAAGATFPEASLEALDGKAYPIASSDCVIADASGPIGLGGVMGGTSTGASETTTEVFVESAYFDPINTAETGRRLSLFSDAQYRFARGVDPEGLVPGLELATRLILDLCGGEASEVRLAGAAPARLPPVHFDPGHVRRLTGLEVAPDASAAILNQLGFEIGGQGIDLWRVAPPSWRRDVDGPADLVEEIARITGFAALPPTPLSAVEPRPGGVLTARQARARVARRALAAAGYAETVGWSFVSRAAATLFGGGDERLVLANPIASDLDCMRPSALPGLILAAGRNAARGFPDAALFEIGPVFAGDRPADQRTAVAAIVAPHAPRRWDGGKADDVFTVKADLMALLEELGAPVGSLQLVQEASPWWRPGQSARLQLGPKAVLAEFGAVHPSVLKALDVEGPVYAFELWLEAVPEPKRKAAKSRPALALSPLMPLSRDFAFVVDKNRPAGELVRAVAGADKALIAGVRVFDVYEGPGVPEGSKSVAIEAILQPREKTLTEPEIEALSASIVAAAGKLGARLRT